MGDAYTYAVTLACVYYIICFYIYIGSRLVVLQNPQFRLLWGALGVEAWVGWGGVGRVGKVGKVKVR